MHRALNASAVSLLLCFASQVIRAQGVDFTPLDSGSPPQAASPALDASMRELATHALPQLLKTGGPGRSGDLTLLQLAVGDYAAAARTAADLPAQARATGTSLYALALEIFAQAKVAQEGSGKSFEESYRAAYEKVLASLDDRLTYDTQTFLGTPDRVFQGIFGQSLQKYRTPTHLSLDAAVELVRSYVWWQASASFFPLIDSLNAAEWKRRYAISDGELIPTPDGAHVSTLIVRPRSTAPLPTLLSFCIYTYPWNLQQAVEVASHGYVSVMGFTRGKYTSRDPIVILEKDGADSRALIEWISLQAWGDGRVGMYAGSYCGFTQWSTLKKPPAALKAIMSQAAVAPGIGEVTEHGIFLTDQYKYVPYTTKGPMLDEAGYNDEKHWDGLDRRWYLSGRPYRDLELIDGVPNPIYRRWLSHPTYDEYWQQMTPQGEEFAKIKIPVLQTTGYFDGGQIGTLHYFEEHHRHSPQTEDILVIGPYGHLGAQHQSDEVIYGYTIDPAARMNMHDLRYAWFDHVLKGGPRPALLEDTVNYEVMGANRWRHAPSLEAMSTHSLRLYVAPGASPTASRLLPVAPPAGTFVEQRIDFKDRSDVDWLPPKLVVSKNLDTHNAIAFVSDPFPADTEVSGLVRGVLAVEINKKDFDFNLRLYELTASGEYTRLTIPYLQRASLLKDRSHRELLTPGVRQTLGFELPGPVSRLIKAGGRLVVLLGVNKERDAEVNYGSGKEVSAESIADAGEPLTVRWLDASSLDIPLAGDPPSSARR